MPKILRIINRFNLGGPTYNAAYLSKYMPEDYRTVLVGGTKDESEASSEFIVKKLGLHPILIPEMKRSISPLNDFRAYGQIKRLIREYHPDIVHTHASKAGTLGRLAAHSEKVPVILHTFHGHVFHSYFNPLSTAFYKKIERHLAQKSNKIIAISEKQKEELSIEHQICPPEKIEVIPLGFDLNRFRENREEKRKEFRKQYNISEGEIVIAIVGRLVPVKNHEFFLRVMKEVFEKSDKKVRAFIVGGGSEMKNIQSKAGELGISFSPPEEAGQSKAPLVFTSWIKNVDFVNAGADIIALTSHNEGTPVSLIEAQASGKPVVSTNVGGIENVVSEGNTGLLSEPGDPDHFVDNLLELINRPEKRKAMGEKGWPFVKEKFHYMRLVDDMDRLYRKLLNEIS